MNEKNRFKLILIGTIAFTALVVYAIISFIISLSRSATLSTTIAPSFATLTIDRKQYKANQEIKLKPTENTTVVISAEGFKSQEISISLTKNETSSITTFLTPNDDDMSWYYSRPEENRLLLMVGGIQAAESAQKYAETYPISTVLPIISVENNQETNEWREFRIDGGKLEDCKKNPEFCLVITDSTGDNRNRAIKAIQDKGFNPNNYEIIYKYKPIEKLDQSTLNEIYQKYGVNR